MKILKTDLQLAATKGIITSEQATRLWTFFESLRPEQGKFQGLHVLYYFGGILILASMSWFLTNAWSEGLPVMLISSVFAAFYIFVGNILWNKHNLKIPGGLLITAATGLTPVFIYGFQKATGLWPQGDPGSYRDYHIWVKGSWAFMEVGTIVASLIALRFYRFTFITFPLAFSLWYMSMDLTPLLFGKENFSFDERKIVSCVFGIAILIFSYWADRKYKENDFAFWTYLYGMLTFWGGLSIMDSKSEVNKLIYCMLNIGFVFLSVYLRRKVFLVFGFIGVFGYISHLAWEVFKESYILPIALACTGLLVVFAGVKYQRNREKFEAFIEKRIPTFLMKWRPEERA